MNMIGESVKNIGLNHFAMAQNPVSFIKWVSHEQYHIKMKAPVMMMDVLMRSLLRDVGGTSNREKEKNDMRKWVRLNMKIKAGSPPLDTLVALRLVPLGIDGMFDSGYYEAGYFSRDERNPKSRKIWWFSRGSSHDPVRMKKHYDIWWCVIPQFDGDI